MKQDVFVTEGRSIDDTNIVSKNSSFSSSLNCINENTDSRHDDVDPRILKLAKKALSNQPELSLKLSDLSREDVIYKALDTVNNYGMDVELERHYLGKQKLVLSLDDEDIFSELDSNTLLTELEKYLIDLVDSKKNSNIVICTYLQGYSIQDSDDLLIDSSLIVPRNKAWVSKIEDYLKEYNNILFAVGNDHLFGEMGLLRLLMDEGYLINRLNDDLTENKFSIDDLNYYKASAIELFIRDENGKSLFNQEPGIKLDDQLYERVDSDNPFNEIYTKILGATSE
ncbi:TraB/GumN family protein [Rickettsia felis]|nr:TraB/GumN family protein [Rickettsia felis]